MKSEKLIAGIAISAVATLLLIPKTRRMIYDGLCSITDSLKGFAEDAKDMAAKGGSELSKFADKAKEATSAVKETKESWQ